MSRLIPTQIDTDVDSERELLEQLRMQLPADCEVYHNLQFRTREKNPREGECDMVILSRELGLVIVEVKGGQVAYVDNRWSVTARGVTREVNPVDQCLKAKDYFVAKMGGRAPLRITYAIATPYSNFAGADLQGHEDVLIDGRHLGTLSTRLKEIADRQAKHVPMDDTVLPLVRSLLNPVFAAGVSLAAEITHGEAEILRMTTQQQIGWQQFRGDTLRALVQGPAGTGKTVIAMTHAANLARVGKRVLLVCFNRALKDHLCAVLDRQDPEVRANLTIQNVHGLAYALCKDAQCAELSREDGPRDVHFDHVANRPRLALNAYDVVLVDEGQDLTPEAWMMLLNLLTPENGLIVFYEGIPRQVMQEESSR